MTILVTGATGHVGRNVVGQLLDAGAHVRAVARNPATAALPPGAEVVRGDLTDPAGLRRALSDVDRLFLFPVEETAAEVIAVAAAAGVRRIVDLSAASVTVGLHVNPVETAVERSGLEWTHVRPGGFMTNVLGVWAPMIRAERVVRYPFADQAANMIHEADIAAVAVAALLDAEHHGASYTLTGPEMITTRDQVAAIAAALGEPVHYEEVTREAARAILHAQGGFAAAAADLMLGFVEYSGETPDDGYADQDWSALERTWPDVEKVTGRPPRDFRQWATDHADDFR